jgi:hypothetical protein
VDFRWKKCLLSLLCFCSSSSAFIAKKRTTMIKISLFFSSVCVFFRSLLKKRACATFVEKDTFYGEENHR